MCWTTGVHAVVSHESHALDMSPQFYFTAAAERVPYHQICWNIYNDESRIPLKYKKKLMLPINYFALADHTNLWHDQTY